MKFLERWKHLSKHRDSIRRGKLYDNINSPGGVKPPQTTVSTSNSVPARTQAFVQGPQIDVYLQTAEWKSPTRHAVAFNHLQPRIAVKEPWATSSTYIQNTQPQTGIPPSGLTQGQYIAEIKALAPPMTRSRDLLWDAGNSKTLQRMTFITPSQTYFNERTPITDFVAPSYYSNQVTTNIYPLRQGWEQAFVQEPGMRQNEIGIATPYHLSTPLKVTTIIGENYKTPVTHAKSPKRKRTGG
jgi:hypothetical protein